MNGNIGGKFPNCTRMSISALNGIKYCKYCVILEKSIRTGPRKNKSRKKVPVPVLEKNWSRKNVQVLEKILGTVTL